MSVRSTKPDESIHNDALNSKASDVENSEYTGIGFDRAPGDHEIIADKLA